MGSGVACASFWRRSKFPLSATCVHAVAVTNYAPISIGIMCACLPYLRFIYEYIGKFATSLSSRSRSRTKTKSKQSDPNHDGHPFQQLNEAREGGRIHKTSEFVISTSHEDEDDEIDRPAHVPKTYVRNDPVRNDIRRMENDFDRRKEEEQKKRSGESVLLEDNFPRAVK